MRKPMRECLDNVPPLIQIPCMCDGLEALQIENFGDGEMVIQLVPLKSGWKPYSVAVPVSDLRAALDKLEATDPSKEPAAEPTLDMVDLTRKLLAGPKGVE